MPTLEELAQNDVNANKNMADDPNWSDVERDRYQAAYNGAKQKRDQQK